MIEGSDIKHLDTGAIRLARENYKKKQNREHISAEIDKMSDDEFLAKVKLAADGKLTNAAMVLLVDKLSDVFDDEQKENKVKYYLKVLSKKDAIKYTGGNRSTGVWVLGNSDGI